MLFFAFKEWSLSRNYPLKGFYDKNAETQRRRESVHSIESILSAQRFGRQVCLWHTSKRPYGVLLSKSPLNSKKGNLCVSAFEIKKKDYFHTKILKDLNPRLRSPQSPDEVTLTQG